MTHECYVNNKSKKMHNFTVSYAVTNIKTTIPVTSI